MTIEAMKQALEGGGLYEITGRIEDIDKCIVHRSVIKEALAQPEQEPVADPFADIHDKRIGEMTAEQQDRAIELWLRNQKGWLPMSQREHVEALLRVIDGLRTTPPQPNVDADDTSSERVDKTDKNVHEPEQEPNWRHCAGVWEGMAFNGLQWLRNIVEIGSDPKEALANMEQCFTQCKAVQAPQPKEPEQEHLDDALRSLDFYRRRVEALQQWQSKMRDPERMIVCDIIANGCTLEPEGDRYKQPAQRKPLTDEQKQKIEAEWNGSVTQLINTIEADHGIKGAA